MSDIGRPIGGGGDGPRAQWWKDYYARPEVKEKRAKYMRDRRKKQQEALLQKWTPANNHPSTDRIVLVVCETEDGDTVWLGYYEDDGWYLAEGDAVFVKFWMELPQLPGAAPDHSIASPTATRSET